MNICLKISQKFQVLCFKISTKINRFLVKGKCIVGKKTAINKPEFIKNFNNNKQSINLGNNTTIAGELTVYPGGRIKIGDWCFVSANTRIWSNTSVTIGNRVLIAHNVTIMDNRTHPINPVKRHQQYVHIVQKGHPKDIELGGKPVVIEDDVWIGCNSIILRGVKLGKGAVVGAGSVVTKDVPPLTIVVGNPARIVRKIYEDDEKEAIAQGFVDEFRHL